MEGTMGVHTFGGLFFLLYVIYLYGFVYVIGVIRHLNGQ